MKTEEQLAKLIELQEETTRLIAASFSRTHDTQGAAAVALSQAGFSGPPIGQLLSMPTDSVGKAVSRAKKK